VRNVRVQVAYDGSRFFGWQRQAGFASVQGALEQALLGLTGSAVVVHGAGRTDTGVHALGQVAHFHVDTRLDDERLLFALNHHVPRGVVVRALETCRDDFHARFDARGKRYLYLVLTSRFPPPFGREYCHWVHEPLDLAAMRAAAALLAGRHDFSAFAGAGSPRASNVRKLRPIHVVARRSRLLFAFAADGFLYNMARALTGTLLEVGRGKLTPGQVGQILAGKDRRRAGPTVPGSGLYLASVRYGERLFGLTARPPRAGPGAFGNAWDAGRVH
jgi:tRNA pseudouridine38-40 synthase